MNVTEQIQSALSAYVEEARAFVGPLAATRYDRALWPTLGQYDYFCAQALYALIRQTTPDLVVEVSTSSGYSTCITAAAMKANNKGRIVSFDIDQKASQAAGANLARLGLAGIAELVVGDARVAVTARQELRKADVYFLDSLHTAAFMRWFMDAFLPEADDKALFHVHDCMPWSARVRREGTAGRGLILDIKRFIYDRYISRIPAEERVNIRPMPPLQAGELPCYNGVETMEAALANELAHRIAKGESAFLYDLADQHPECDPRRFDAQVVGRESAAGKPFEWNEAFWCRAAPAWAAYQAWQAEGAPMRTQAPAA